MRNLARLVFLTGLVVVAVGVPGAGTAVTQPLVATVGPGFTINLTDSAGVPVSHLDPGAYTIKVSDKGTLHNFHLTGTGVDQATDIDLTENKTWSVTFTDGTYTYMCDAHPVQMKKTFTVGTVPPPPPPPPTKPKLFGRVGPGKTISLRTAAGRKVASVKAGAYVLVVNDRSKKDNFHLSGKGVNRKTSVKGLGRKSWPVRLAKGVYKFRSDASKKLRGSFRVT
ncbi:MAG: hypothetical protein M3R70_05695 [Actinomycetota bacterium]|nr:hypothetical protein [Actinomycetota bacterium]